MSQSQGLVALRGLCCPSHLKLFFITWTVPYDSPTGLFWLLVFFPVFLVFQTSNLQSTD